MKTLITHATVVNEGRSFDGAVLIDDDRIARVDDASHVPHTGYDEVIDATGCFLLPGVIDSHVHFREPGLTDKADIASESRAAAWGGVTTYFDMPNTVPQTTTIEALDDKFRRAAQHSHVNYSFFFGATNDNVALFAQLDKHRLPGIKLFMGSSTGNMLVDKLSSLNDIFAQTPLPLMAHCEDTSLINAAMKEAKQAYGDDPDVIHHPEIRSEQACLSSSALAVKLAQKYNTRLHVAHVSTARETELFEPWQGHGPMPRITAEAVVAHLLFTDDDYARLGTRIKCNPAVKSAGDREGLRRALADGRITTVATDHAPHRLADKQGGCARAASGMPMVQFSLPAMLELTDQGVITIERLVQLMCHHPAQRFDVAERGFLRPGYKADLVLVRPDAPWTVTTDIIQSKCGWSPLEGHTFRWRVEATFCNGRPVFRQGIFDPDTRGEEVCFRIGQ